MKRLWNTNSTDFGVRGMKPAASASSFQIFYNISKILWPLSKKAVPPKRCKYLTRDPPQKKWMERTFFKLAHFWFFLQFTLCSKFLWISKIRLYSIYANANFSKFTDLKNRGFRKFIYIVGQIFDPPDFWGLLILKNLHLHKLEYNRIFDIHRNFEQSVNWRKNQKCASLKKVRSIHFFVGGSGVRYLHFFGGTVFFREGSQNFRIFKHFAS